MEGVVRNWILPCALFVLAIAIPHKSRAAEVKCLFLYEARSNDQLGRERQAPYQLTAPDPPCNRVGILGEIEDGDAEKLARLLAARSEVSTVYMLSQGGNLYEALEIGRIIRKRFLATRAKWPSAAEGNAIVESCGTTGRPVCCADTCALAYLAGIQFERDETVELHRPTLAELGERFNTEPPEALKDASQKVLEYFTEMEIEDRLYRLMMSAPDRIVVDSVNPAYPDDGDYYRYPPSVRDWLKAQCSDKVRRPREEMDRCMRGALDSERAERRRRIQPQLLSDEDELVRADELDEPRSSENKDAFRAMNVNELRKFILAAGSNKKTDGAYKRLEELTGDRLVGIASMDCGWAVHLEPILSSCTAVIESGEKESFNAKMAAYQRRGDVYRIWKKDYDRSIDDYTRGIELSVLSKAPLSLSLDLTTLKQLYYSRAEAFTHRGYLDQAIGDYTKLIELNPQFSEYYLVRGRLYEMKGDKAAAIANYKALLGANPTSDPAQKALVRLEGSNLILPGNHRHQLKGTVR
jgi:tetratricopeptide (TPR) repeat protein